MLHQKNRLLFSMTLIALGLPCAGMAQQLTPLQDLGEALFFDVDLSINRTQSCASCHDPAAGFSNVAMMGSIGDNGTSVGDRNAPTAGYASMIPAFGKDADGNWHGGQFWDGRASSLEDQAGGPPLNPDEMGMKDAASVVERLREKDIYIAAFESQFGADIFDDADAAYAAMTQAIAAFERTDQFAPFDSRYDRYLLGEEEFTREELLGETLFFSQQFTNCNLCHQVNARAAMTHEVFTNHQYFNIGVPENTDLRKINGVEKGTVDIGLAANPSVMDAGEAGKFKTPTLRNVAVTGPYMHNGVFADLRTVVLFYNRYNSKSAARQINPETGEDFGAIIVPHTLANEELTEGPALEDREIDALVAFMKTLTDKRYESLLEVE